MKIYLIFTRYYNAVVVAKTRGDARKAFADYLGFNPFVGYNYKNRINEVGLAKKGASRVLLCQGD